MRTVFAAASIASFASLAAAQSIQGYGRFPCTIVNGDGTFSPDLNQCVDGNLIVPGTNDPTSIYQGDHPAPSNSGCVIEPAPGAYFCGIFGAACTSDANCDNGYCSSQDGVTLGICFGGFTDPCRSDSNCLGYLYCTDPLGNPTTSGTCGGEGAYCQDYTVGSDTNTDAQNEALFNQFCESGYCAYLPGTCAFHVGVGEDCSFDPEFACADGLTCTTDTTTGAQTCTGANGSQLARTRARRSDLKARRNLCPASHSACAIPGAKGFECIDTSSNIEQCGACASEGGVDCTQIEGVAAVGCVAGVCEIWSCEDGFTYDAAKGACVA
ncbi:Antifreeze glycopeptide AFGP polyprotein [Rhodotorula toruloides ATCC 204091]|uniref:Antifreeze glycopeptide AFGP poly protein n=1 Tax=Rhodotorula toruloides TaxID=5286 RepID=A0A0K3CIE4_RHOTO|nr:Antifreeze glycopeptide AFGP polyprotein [Rhodotorula toruloides ATCC 204091]KAK4331740.1 Antifreeze glycopeptide AFGP poly protein [Rhodotorula toruloides]PRQ73066.1 antifreeze glycopeptide AFGP poly protein [Rhodotorula toruloides]